MVIPLFVERDAALRAIEAALAADDGILLVAQRSEEPSDPPYLDIYDVGTECRINRVLRMPDGTVSVMAQGVRRVRIDTWVQQTPFGRVRGTVCEDPETRDEKSEALVRTVLSYFERCAKLSQRLGDDVYAQATDIDSPGATWTSSPLSWRLRCRFVRSFWRHLMFWPASARLAACSSAS
jgi:ATP-dependent Lon protease